MTDPRKISEKVFQSEVIKAARIHGSLIAHFRPAMTKDGWKTAVQGDGAGFPDCVLIRGKRLIFAELKSDKGKIYPQQKQWLDALRGGQWTWLGTGGEKVNYEVYVWRPAEIDEISEDPWKIEKLASCGWSFSCSPIGLVTERNELYSASSVS